MCQCEGREHRTSPCYLCRAIETHAASDRADGSLGMFANGGLISGDMPSWVDAGCDYVIPLEPVAFPGVPQLWDGDNA